MRARRALPCLGAAISVVLAVVTTGGCGSSAGAADSGPSTTPATTTGTSAASSTKSPAVGPASVAVSTVKGRLHDVGTIVGTKTQGGLTVLVLDRWTAKGMTDAQLAAKGAPVAPHTSRKFFDQNSSKTYLVPVNPTAPIVVNTCDQTPRSPPTMTSTPTSLTDWLASSGRAKVVVLLTYDASGRLARLDTDPAC